MHAKFVLCLIVLAVIFAAGCTQTQPPQQMNVPTDTPAPAATPPAPTTPTVPVAPPAVQPPASIETLPEEEAAKPSISAVLTSAPKLAVPSTEFSVSWKIVVSEPVQTSHSAVHYGKQSVPLPTSPSDYEFTSHVFCVSKPCNLPTGFSTSITIPEGGIYYYRAHTIIGGAHFWSDEASVNVSSAPEVVRVVTMPSGGGGGGY